MDTQDIIIVRRIYETGSVTKAATMLYISPQALSKRLQKIEGELNTVLFDRTPAGVVPTEDGVRFYSESEHLYNTFKKFKESVSREEIPDVTKVHVASSLGVMALVTPEKIRKFRRAHPDTELIIKEYPDNMVDRQVLDGTADIGLAIDPVLDELARIPIIQYPLCAVSMRGGFLDDLEQISYRDLNGIPVAIENPDFKVNSIVKTACRSSGFNLDIYFETLELDLAHSLALQGECVAISVDNDRILPKGEDVMISRFKNPLYWSIAAVRRSEGALSRAEQDFIDFICEVFAGQQ